MMKAMGELEYDSIEYIVAMDKEEVMRLLYIVKVTKGDKVVEVTEAVPIKSKKASNLVTTEDWLKLIEDEFDIFVDTIAPNMARTTVKMDPDGNSAVAVKQYMTSREGTGET
eukprot:13312215-Ditylum_brightwellii.AAC.1